MSGRLLCFGEMLVRFGAPAGEMLLQTPRLSAHIGQAGVLLRAYVYARMLGAEGARRVAEFAALNASYLMSALRAPRQPTRPRRAR